MPGYDTIKAAYRVFSTDDYGANWKKRGRIKTPDTFYRVDFMLVGDGGGNFDTLTAVGALMASRPVDPALPDRYVRQAT